MMKRLLIAPLVLIMLVLEAFIISPVEAGIKAAATDTFMSQKKKKTVVSKQVDHHAIGCILPLTGRYASAGNKALEAVILAADIFDPLKRYPFKLVIEDSKSDATTARAAVAKLAREKVLCILGPFGNAEAVAAAGEAQRLKIPIITLTQKEKITDIGDNVFRNYMTNEMQIRGLVTYTMNEMDLTRFAVIYPDDHYGREMEKLFRDEVLRQGGKNIKSQYYNKTQVDFGNVIKAITDTKRISSKEKEFKKSDAEHKQVIGFDALFLPDSPARVHMIVPQLAYYNVRGIKLLGTSLWNSPDLLKTVGEYLDGAVFADGFCLNSFYPEANDFIDVFYTHYGREPDVIDALVYDAARIVVTTIEENDIETREQLKNSLLRLENRRGVTGNTSFSGKRDANKDVFILTVNAGQIVQIK